MCKTISRINLMLQSQSHELAICILCQEPVSAPLQSHMMQGCSKRYVFTLLVLDVVVTVEVCLYIECFLEIV